MRMDVCERNTETSAAYNKTATSCEAVWLDCEAVVKPFPSEILNFVDIRVYVFAKASASVAPCASIQIPTGIKLTLFIPISYNLRFNGYVSESGLKCKSKYVCPINTELMITVTNFSDTVKCIPIDMPLGFLQLRKNADENSQH